MVLNLTAIDPSAQTFLRVYPGPNQPTISDMNRGTGDMVANLVVATLSGSGTVTIYDHSGSVNLAVDVAGWFQSSA